MIYFTTFILALFLTPIARALPHAGGDPNYPDSPIAIRYDERQYSQPPPSPLRATFDTTFDNSQGSLNNVACSNGDNGLASKYPTFGNIPNYPFIGGAYDVAWNSPNCGACWVLSNGAISIAFTAVDTAGAGFNLGTTAFKTLNNGQIGEGVLDVTAQQVPRSVCGM